MKKDDIKEILKKYGVRTKSIGSEMLADLILFIYKDIKNGKETLKTYRMKKYYTDLAISYDLKESTIPSNIQHAVTQQNIYGNNLKPKELIDSILINLLRG